MTVLFACIGVTLLTAYLLYLLWREDDERWKLEERDDYSPPKMRRKDWMDR